MACAWSSLPPFDPGEQGADVSGYVGIGWPGEPRECELEQVQHLGMKILMRLTALRPSTANMVLGDRHFNLGPVVNLQDEPFPFVMVISSIP
jgi:hypothetical protein